MKTNYAALLLAFLLPLGAAAEVDRTHPPEAAPATMASFPDYRSVTLPNGLKVFVIESPREPTVTFRLLFRAGDTFDGAKPGLAGMVADLLNRGTARRDAGQFAQETDLLGASVEAGTGPDSLELSASGLALDLPAILDLFADAALHPVFPAEELEKLRRQDISGLAQERQSPATLASRLAGQLVFGAGNPYAAYPTEASLNSIQRNDLVRFHHDFFAPDNATLAIVGDVKADDVLPLIEKAFGAWEPAFLVHDQLGVSALPAPPAGPLVHLVDRPGSVQSTIVIAGRGMRRDNPDAAEFGVANSILGGGFSGRLFQNLRERHGFTYGASSSMDMDRLVGMFTADTQVRNAVTLPAIQEMLREINRLRDEPAPEPELAMQRQYLTGNYLLSLESPLRTAERVQNIDLYSLPADYYKTYTRRISETPASRVQELAGKYLDPRQMSIIVVGEASEVLPALKQLGPVQVYDLDLKPIAAQSQ